MSFMSETPAEDGASSEPVSESAKVETPEPDTVEKGEPAPDDAEVRGIVEAPENEKSAFGQRPSDGQTF
jgi:hypothetical protein